MALSLRFLSSPKAKVSWGLASSLILGGCYVETDDATVAEDPSGSGSIVAGTGGTAGDDLACLTTDSVPACPNPPLTIAEATSFGAAAKFVMLGGWAALIDRGDGAAEGRYAALLVAQPVPTPAVTTYEFDKGAASGPLTVLSVWGGFWGVSPVLALVCVTGEGCHVWGASAGEEKILRPLATAEPPLNGEIRALFLGALSGYCALGLQLACLNSEGLWEVAPDLPPEAGTQIEHVIPSSDRYHPTVALTDTGVIVERMDAGDWTIIPTNPLGRITSLGGEGVFSDESGTWTADNLDSPVCKSPGLTHLQSSTYGSGGNQLVAAFEDGSLYRRSAQGSWCSSRADLPMLGASALQCGDYSMYLVLSPERWVSQFGELGCAR